LKKHRPNMIKSETVRENTGHGTLFVTIGYKMPHKPFEVIARIGKVGGCDSAWMEALTRCVSIGIQCGVPVHEFIDQLQGITCDAGDDGFPSSPADGLARVLQEFTDGK
jgi:ribonucleoside-diphosphate reductase alpha chain